MDHEASVETIEKDGHVTPHLKWYEQNRSNIDSLIEQDKERMEEKKKAIAERQKMRKLGGIAPF